MPLKIAVDSFPLCRARTGIGNYIFYLLVEWVRQCPEDTFFLFSDKPIEDLGELARFPNVVNITASFLSVSQSAWSQTALSWLCFKHRIDLFWGATQSIPLFKRKNMRTILTIYDFVYLLHPQTTSPIRRWYQKIFSKRMVKKADKIIAISKGSSTKLEKIYGRRADEVIYPPLRSFPNVLQSDTKRFLASRGLKNKEFLLTVGSLEPRKRLKELLEVYFQVLTKASEEASLDKVYPLVVIGGGGWKNREILVLLQTIETKFPDYLKPLGFSSDRDLGICYRSASAFILMSCYEGYGMPIAEARSLGTEVIYANTEEMQEAALGEGIAIDRVEELIDKGLFLKKEAKPQALYTEKNQKDYVAAVYSDTGIEAKKLVQVGLE